MKTVDPEASGDPSQEVVQSTANALASIGVRIREARAARFMTLQSLADATGSSVSMISLVERGRASPLIGSLVLIAGALGVAMSDLVAADPTSEEWLIVRSGEAAQVTEVDSVVRRLLREDRGVPIAINEHEPHTGALEVAHDAIPQPDADQIGQDGTRKPQAQSATGGQRTQNRVFAVTLHPQRRTIDVDGTAVPVSPGMAVTAELRTGSRRILDYNFAPIAKMGAEAMRER